MSIRLNKAIRELNIGLGTAVEFLEKRPDLGEVKSDPSCKISDEQYKARCDRIEEHDMIVCNCINSAVEGIYRYVNCKEDR